MATEVLPNLLRDGRSTYGPAAGNSDAIGDHSGSSTEEGVVCGESTLCFKGVANLFGEELPYTLEVPENVIDEVPLVIIKGYCGIPPAYKPLRRWTARYGKPAITYRTPRAQPWQREFHPLHALHPDRLHSQAAGAVIKDVHGRYGFDNFDGFLHSMGGWTGTGTAEHMPERFRTLVFAGSVGLNGHTLGSLGRRLPSYLWRDLLPSIGNVQLERDTRAFLHVLDYIFRNPLRTAREALGVSQCDIRERVRILGSLGIKTAGLQFGADGFFYPHEVASHAENVFDVFRVIEDRWATHEAPQTHPKEVAETTLSIIDELHGAPAT